MTSLILAAGEATDDGKAFLGFLILGGILWAIYKAIPKSPSSYDVEMKGKIKPNR